jgi:hypothetical protein
MQLQDLKGYLYNQYLISAILNPYYRVSGVGVQISVFVRPIPDT